MFALFMPLPNKLSVSKKSFGLNKLSRQNIDMRKKKNEKSVLSRTRTSLMKKKKLTVRELSELTAEKGRRVSPSTISEWAH